MTAIEIPCAPAFFLAPAFFPIDSLPHRCICPTRVESRVSHMESTKTIAFLIQSVDPTSLFPCPTYGYG